MTKRSLDKVQKIYVNRSLNMARIKSIGFDMDHTLVVYQRDAFENLAFTETLQKFIEAGYPNELASLSFDPNFVIRGLLVDRERGNLLKADEHKYVKKAFHGRLELDKKTRHETYNAQSFRAENFLSIDTFFALSEVQLFVEIVDYMRLNPKKIKREFREVYSDLRTFIDLSHADGSIKNKVLKNPETYFQRNKSRLVAIMRLKEGGKKTFLLTNSMWDYTDAVMTYSSSPYLKELGLTHWLDLFDFVIVGAKKPGFFTGDFPFQKVDRETGQLHSYKGPFEPGIYHGGNGYLFQSLTGQKGDEILYCGDHIYGDIIRSKEVFNWRTLLVVEELVDEFSRNIDPSTEWDEIKKIFQKREELDEIVQKLSSQINTAKKNLKFFEEKKDARKVSAMSKNIGKLEAKLSEKVTEVTEIDKDLKDTLQRREIRIHPLWGDFMRVGLEKSRFARQIENYACLYTADIGNLRFYSPFKRFRSPRDLMPHDLKK